AHCAQNQSGEHDDDGDDDKKLDESESTAGGKCRMSKDEGRRNDRMTNAEKVAATRVRHSAFVFRHSGGAGHVCCCKPWMMAMSGMNSASTMVPTITARNTIMSGSSAAVKPATALSTSSS